METAPQPCNSIREELDFVQEYLENESLRYGEQLTWNCTVDPQVNKEVIIPRMLIQTFVENSINHGLFQNPAGGKVGVSLHRTGVGTLIMITDNGVNQLEEVHMTHHRRQERIRILDCFLKLFNQRNTYQISYQILDRGISDHGIAGTRVVITIDGQ